MTNNSNFKIDNFKQVIFLGEHECLNDLIKINKKFNLKSEIITSPVQSQILKKNKIKFKAFKVLDNKFEKYILRKYKIDETLFLSIRSRWIFKKKQIENFFKFNLINYHPTRLPYFAGGADFSWRIIQNDRIDFITFHLVNEKIDNGDIIHYEKSILPKNCKIPLDLQKYTSKKLIYSYEKLINKISKKQKFNFNSQNNHIGKYYPRIYSKLNSWIDWSMNSVKLERFMNAFDDPYDGAQTFIRKTKVKIKKITLHSGETPNHPFMSGLVTRHDGNWLVVSSADENSFLIEEVLNDKNRNIINNIKVGDRFFTPKNKLDDSKSDRIKFGPMGLI